LIKNGWGSTFGRTLVEPFVQMVQEYKAEDQTNPHKLGYKTNEVGVSHINGVGSNHMTPSDCSKEEDNHHYY
jgi:hypothetical protein